MTSSNETFLSVLSCLFFSSLYSIRFTGLIILQCIYIVNKISVHIQLVNVWPLGYNSNDTIVQQHPIPRNITGFQFKLIGDMTVKQFAYLAVGVVSGYILFRTLPGPAIVGFLVGISLAGAGAALAFLPIQGRPLDVWLTAFVKSIYSPTVFVWHKDNRPPPILAKPAKGGKAPLPAVATQTVSTSDMADVDKKLATYLAAKQKQPEEKLDKQEKEKVAKTAQTMQKPKKPQPPPKPPVQQPQPPPTTSSQPPQRPPVASPAPAAPVATPPPSLPVEKLFPAKKSAPHPQEKHADKQEALEKLKQDKEELERKISRMRQKMEVETLSEKQATGLGFPPPSQHPNTISGVVLDPQNKQLAGVLVSVKNADKMTVRALKTNQLGQFASSAPLDNGVYYVEIDDPTGKYDFDIIKITFSGGPAKPLEIVAKSKEGKTIAKGNEIRNRLFKS